MVRYCLRSSAVSPDEHASASSVAVFDRYAAMYDSTVDASIRTSGETVEFFAQLKAELLTRLAASRSSICFRRPAI